MEPVKFRDPIRPQKMKVIAGLRPVDIFLMTFYVFLLDCLSLVAMP